MNKPTTDWDPKGQLLHFWVNKARHYPLPFDVDCLAQTRRLIDRIAGMGVDWDEIRILDIGCGTGIFTLPLAVQAEKIEYTTTLKKGLIVWQPN